MPAAKVLFCDVGGVLLTNGWDRPARRRAAEVFRLDWDALEQRHEVVVADFETGRLSMEDYLDYTAFDQKRPFTREQFREFMLAQSEPCSAALAVMEKLAGSRRCLMATLNNESLELNQYRIERFRLRDYFDLFFSSCYLGLRKPDQRLYRLVLQLTQRRGEECLFIDDRELNLQWAERAGMRVLRYRDAAQLDNDLQEEGLL